MTTDDSTGKPFSLRRWSERKLAAARAARGAPVAGESAPLRATPAENGAGRDASGVAPASAPAVAPRAPDLPPVESLTIDSDFTGYFQPKVDEQLKRQALKQLFRDPHFNVMDGLDVYIDDYSQPDPISPELVRELVQGRYIFDPPRTRVNEQGVVEDVPPDDAIAPLPQLEPAKLPDEGPSEPVADCGMQPDLEPESASSKSVGPAQ